MSASCSHSRLPPEIWIRVFDWATYSSARELHYLLEVPFFDGITHQEVEAQVKSALHTKTSLSLVCRQWRTLSEQYLYEDLRIRHGKHILADILERSRKECPQSLGKGRYVNRIVLPNMQKGSTGYGHSRHWADEVTSRIVKCCPNLFVLSRYYSIYTKYDAWDDMHNSEPDNYEEDCCLIYDPPLPGIQRLDWFNGGMIGTAWHPTICAVPSSLWSSQHLEVLSLSGDNYFWGPRELQSFSGSVILLPKVHTLRVGSIYAFGVPGISDYTLALPALCRMILDRGEALHRLIECVIASPPPSSDDRPVSPDVKVLEVGSPHWRFMRSDYISSLIRHYPSAESLYYPVFYARPLRCRRLDSNALPYGPHDAQKAFSNLQYVGLHAEPNPELSYPDETENADAIWSHLYAHARALLGSTSPNLLESRLPGVRSITLYGHPWRPLIADSRFHHILDLARERDAELIADDPSVANALEDTLFGYRSYLAFEWIYELS